MSAPDDARRVAETLTPEQRKAVELIGRAGLRGLRPGDNRWPYVKFEQDGFTEQFDGEDVDTLARLGIANADADEKAVNIGICTRDDVGEIELSWLWSLTPLGLAARAILVVEDAA